jgi:glycosyltransferase involved in cell wall biosynthesis
MWNLHLSLARLAERLLPGRVSYYLSDYWPTLPNPYADYWRAASQSRPATAAKALLRPAAERHLAGEKRMLPAFAHAMTPSAFVADELRRQKIALGAVEVVPGGIDTRRYARPSEHQGPADDSLSLLYVGRLTPEKGIETAIEALGLLRRERGLEASHLVVAGTGSPAYQEKLRVKAAAAGPVVFLGKQTEDALPAIYRAATALLFTSIWPEPFARVPLEAMAAGTPVIGTTSGGSEELLRDGENCLTYPAGDAAALAQAVKRLWKDPALRRRLIRTGQREVCDKYDLKHMVGGVEAHLLRLTTRPDPHFR